MSDVHVEVALLDRDRFRVLELRVSSETSRASYVQTIADIARCEDAHLQHLVGYAVEQTRLRVVNGDDHS